MPLRADRMKGQVEFLLLPSMDQEELGSFIRSLLALMHCEDYEEDSVINLALRIAFVACCEEEVKRGRKLADAAQGEVS